jgi:hypothetical protein
MSPDTLRQIPLMEGLRVHEGQLALEGLGSMVKNQEIPKEETAKPSEPEVVTDTSSSDS